MMCNRDYCTNCLAVFKFSDASNLVAIRAVAWIQAWKKCVHGAEVLEELKCTVFGGEGRFEKKGNFKPFATYPSTIGGLLSSLDTLASDG